MEKINLNGKWNLLFDGIEYETDVPVSDYSALMQSGAIPNPLYGTNEGETLFVADTDKTFTREFEIKERDLSFDNIVLSCKALDTLTEIYINSKKAEETNNAYVKQEINIKEYLHEGTNKIQIKFLSPTNYVKSMQKKEPLPKNANGIDGVAYIRKPACSFGWDWGINMPLSGIMGDIEIIQYNDTEIRDFYIKQEHKKGKVTLYITTDAAADCSGTLIYPNGDKKEFEVKDGRTAILIDNPELWWTRELSNTDTQPLYIVVINNIEKKVGLRTITLNREKDKHGNNFQFILNGVPIFAKGASLIPPDAMSDRITKDTYIKLIDDAAEANFNMIRVWGGGYYGSDDFYDLCDEKGILVWQDFMFACLMYPLYNEDFIKNVKSEAEYNVKRIMHHPSLALWCGNNEIEAMFSYMPTTSKLVKSYKSFFYDILPREIRKYDSDTPYIETSPIGSSFGKNITSDKYGDTHMWNVWHGSKKFDYYTERYPRFCSEYGIESLPSKDCIASFAPKDEFKLYSKTMLAHQKCSSGNSKMMYYLLEKFRKPKYFDDLIYLTNITQADCVGTAAEHWRENRGRCNGALFWQFNDCWGAPSWSAVDFIGKWKTLMYEARHFFAPLTLAIKANKDDADIFIINDTKEDRELTLKVVLSDFSGNIIKEQSIVCMSNALSAEKRFRMTFGKKNLNNMFVCARIYDKEKLISERTAVLLPDKDLKLKRANIQCSVKDNTIELKSDIYARKVFVTIKGETTPLSDNCFDLLPSETKTIRLINDGNIDSANVSVQCINNVTYTSNRAFDKMQRIGISSQPGNIANRIYYSKN